MSTKKTVTLDNAGTKQRLTTTAATVGQALVAAKVTVDADDTVSAAISAPLADGATIRYTRVDEKSVSKRTTIDFETTYENSRKLDRGETKVQRKGVAGVRTTFITEIRRNGKLMSKKKTGSTVTTKPENKVVLRGTKKVVSVLDGGEPANVGDGGGRRSQIFVTGYTYWETARQGRPRSPGRRSTSAPAASGPGRIRPRSPSGPDGSRSAPGSTSRTSRSRWAAPVARGGVQLPPATYFIVEDPLRGVQRRPERWRLHPRHLGRRQRPEQWGCSVLRVPGHRRAAGDRGSPLQPAGRLRIGLLTSP
ncbi:MAG TPA: G5 domain-containing protein [Microlunatus sp.]